jgi:hypothetical protein
MLMDAQPRDTSGPPELPAVDGLEAGVIEEARRRQLRQRLIAASAALAAAVAAAAGFGLAGAGHHAHARGSGRPSSSPAWLTGAPLRGITHLRLVASQNAGPAYIVNVDSGSAHGLPQLHVPTGPGTVGSALSPLMLVPGGALAVVNHQPCYTNHCATTQDDFLINADGSVRLLASRHFPALQGTTETAYVPGSTTEWVLTWPRHGHCTLRSVPDTHGSVIVPCGDLGPVFPTGVALWTDSGQRSVLVNPRTGAVSGALNTGYAYDLLGHGLAIEGAPYASPTSLSLVNLATGKRLRLGWPSSLHFAYQVFPAPHAPLVAVEFADPAYPPPPRQTIGQAADIWLLNTRTGSFTHVPGFPILEPLKASGIAWTADDRLVVVAEGGGRTTLGVWRPGQHTLAVRKVPALNGYSRFVALVGR